jgi:DEAD/DEAH box helicase domain-containing protein
MMETQQENGESFIEMLEAFQAVVARDLTVVERIALPARPEQREPIPSEYTMGRVGKWLAGSMFSSGLWTHQSAGLRQFSAGKNVVVSTGTASGKSLVFQAAALKLLDERPDAAVLVLYPLKALVADQLVSWYAVTSACGYGAEAVQRLDGDVLPHERQKLMEAAKIVLATPDIVHAWLMSNLAKPAHRRFLSRLALVVIDEAHVFDSVFGSNFAYLFRRLTVAARMADRHSDPEPFRIIAASATIANPAQHLADLTGVPFESVDESSDGSPQQERELLHLAVKRGEEASLAVELHKTLLSSERGSFITFVDSRQGVERLAIRTDSEEVVRPYRSGYEGPDRLAIEQALRDGSLRGVVSTSALELGINIPHFSIGLNMNVPASRKSFRQRLGRVGRRKPGAFAVVAEPYAFRRFGMSFAEYYAASVEPSYLYLQNRFIQYAHARCLSDELEALGISGRKVPPGFVNWPEGFAQIFDFAYVGGPAARPREFDGIHRVGGDAPHYLYPLRNVAEEGFIVATGGGASGPQRRVGNLTLQQAIREAFPGAIYLHMAQGWKVYEWRNTAWERAIRVAQTNSRMFPKPLLRTFVNISLERDGIVNGRFRKGDHGFLAECQLQITERVEGFQERGERKLYRDLQAQDPNMRSKTREFRTTGVVLQISESWFTKKGVKEQVGEVLTELLRREYSISPADIDHAATNIAVVRDGQRGAMVDAIVIYDSTHGSLRLSEPAYTRFDVLLERIRSALSMTPEEFDLLNPEQVSSLESWYRSLNSEPTELGELFASMGTHERPGWLQVYSAGSVVCRRNSNGILSDIEIIAPELVAMDGPARLFYRYKCGGARAMTPADQIEAAGDQWSFTYWNPETGEYADEVDDLVVKDVERPPVLSDSLDPQEIRPPT